jgi:hypothetical protein
MATPELAKQARQTPRHQVVEVGEVVVCDVVVPQRQPDDERRERGSKGGPEAQESGVGFRHVAASSSAGVSANTTAVWPQQPPVRVQGVDLRAPASAPRGSCVPTIVWMTAVEGAVDRRAALRAPRRGCAFHSIRARLPIPKVMEADSGTDAGRIVESVVRAAMARRRDSCVPREWRSPGGNRSTLVEIAPPYCIGNSKTARTSDPRRALRRAPSPAPSPARRELPRAKASRKNGLSSKDSLS